MSGCLPLAAGIPERTVLGDRVDRAPSNSSTRVLNHRPKHEAELSVSAATGAASAPETLVAGGGGSADGCGSGVGGSVSD